MGKMSQENLEKNIRTNVQCWAENIRTNVQCWAENKTRKFAFFLHDT
jgi:hypothetical protein